MLVRVSLLWARLRASLWFLPALLTLGAGLLAFALTELERQRLIGDDELPDWILQGGPEGTREVLGAIAGGLITVTGVVFSVTIIALQLASSQYTPRILRNFTADRSNQLVLGVFIGTFTYTLLVLRVVRSENEPDGAFVPYIAVSVAVLLLLVAVGFLIYFIDHVARSIQIAKILDRVTHQTLKRIDHVFPAVIHEDGSDSSALPESAPEESVRIVARRSGYLQAVDVDALVEVGAKREIVVRMEIRIGQHLLEGETLATAWPADRVTEETHHAIHDAFMLGLERTPEEDIELGIIEIADIGLRSLSTSINDSTTSMQCIDRLAEVVLALGRREPARVAWVEEGTIRFIARPLAFDRAVGVAFDQIRHFGSDNPVIVNRLLHALARVRNLVPEVNRRPVTRQIELLLAEAREQISSPRDREAMERAARVLLEPDSVEAS